MAATSFDEEKPQRTLALLKRKAEEESVQILAQKYGLPYLDLSIFPIEIDAIRLIPLERVRTAEVVAFQVTGKQLKIAARNPTAAGTHTLLAQLAAEGWKVELYLASRRSLEHAWEYYQKIPLAQAAEAGAIQIHQERLAALEQEVTSLSGIQTALERIATGRTTEALEIILAGSIVLDASDVHIEPQEKAVRLRLRLDGVLHDVTEIPAKLFQLLLSRIKLLSELKLNVHDRAQDGRFTIRTHAVEVEVRTSTLPGPYGENVVLRILNPRSLIVSFEELGMQPWVKASMDHELRRPNGMLITTGPTGSGKTTTLYTMLRKIHSPEIKIITLEDPIEYHLPGIEQTQVDPAKGYDFANGLRAIVRQDPDVILVGEIRDRDTADTAINAALTGHLVFSTLHTNNAAGTIPRLINLGVNPTSIAPALNVSMAQRLVRKLCPSCRKPHELAPAERRAIEQELAGFPSGVGTPKPEQWTVFIPPSTDCVSCSSRGYRGRIGVFEIILINESMEDLIQKNPSELDMKKEAGRQGQINMRQDGLLKVLTGVTNFAELERVVGS